MLDNQEGQPTNQGRRTFLKILGVTGIAALLASCGIKLSSPEPIAIPVTPRAEDPFKSANPLESGNYLWCEPKNDKLETTTSGDRIYKDENNNITVAEGILQGGLGIDQWLESIGGPDNQWEGYSMTVITPDNGIIHFSGNMKLGEPANQGGGGKVAKITYANIFTHSYDVFTPAVNFTNRHKYMNINKLPKGTRIIVGLSNIIDPNLEALKKDPRIARSTNGILSVKNDFYPGGKQRLQLEYLERISGWRRVNNPDSPEYLYIDAFRDLPGSDDQLRQDIPWQATPSGTFGITRRELFGMFSPKITKTA